MTGPPDRSAVTACRPRRRGNVARSVLLVVVAALPLSHACGAEPGADASVAEWIERLGDPRYAERLDAQRRLLDVGLAAFDELRVATRHRDAEVADASARLLRQLVARWDWPGDPPAVRGVLESYAGLGPNERVLAIRLLTRQPVEVHAPPLVRLARFEPSPRLSREAAVRLLPVDHYELPAADRRAIADAVERLAERYGPGERPGARWLWWAFADESDATPDAWRNAYEAERRLLETHRGETTDEVLAAVGWQLLRAALRTEDDVAATLAFDALAGNASPRPREARRRAFRWAAEADRWRWLDSAIDAVEPPLAGKRDLYLLAELAEARGNPGGAERLAAEALSAPVDDASAEPLADEPGAILGPRLAVASELQRAGHGDWARAEYAAMSEPIEPITAESAYARWRLADSLQDAGRWSAAAAALAELDDAIHRGAESRERYQELFPGRQTQLLPTPRVVKARRWLFAARAAREAGDDGAEIAALRLAIAADAEDADVLIAMHRVRAAPVDFATDARRRIDANLASLDAMIQTNPRADDAFNHWAWLASNTGRDPEKAVRYSRRSLQLRPNTAEYLDTLGRCLFAAGRLDEAIATQRRAVALQPHVEVLKRQLAEFEAAATEGNE